jgi:Ca2+:H+ antiporter
MNDGLGGVDRADTLPPDSASTDRTHAQGASVEDRELSQQPTQSQDPINISRDATDGPRRRKFMGLFKSGQGDENTLSATETEKSKSGKPTFTVGSQLKATVFNSWINILLVAAPVGSMAQHLEKSCWTFLLTHGD